MSIPGPSQRTNDLLSPAHPHQRPGNTRFLCTKSSSPKHAVHRCDDTLARPISFVRVSHQWRLGRHTKARWMESKWTPQKEVEIASTPEVRQGSHDNVEYARIATQGTSSHYITALSAELTPVTGRPRGPPRCHQRRVGGFYCTREHT